MSYNHFDALACREELLPVEWGHGSSLSCGWCVAERGHPVTWNGCATFHSVQAQYLEHGLGHGVLVPSMVLCEILHHDAVMKVIKRPVMHWEVAEIFFPPHKET